MSSAKVPTGDLYFEHLPPIEQLSPDFQQVVDDARAFAEHLRRYITEGVSRDPE